MNVLFLLAAISAAPADSPPSVPPQWLSERRPPAKLERIVTVAPALTELVFALGKGDLVVGVTRSGRGIVLFLLYGWERALEDFENVKGCLRRAGLLPTSNGRPTVRKGLSRQYSHLV